MPPPQIMISQRLLSILQLVIYHSNVALIFYTANSTNQEKLAQDFRLGLPSVCFVDVRSEEASDLLDEARFLESVSK